jgi:hypothetical protein
MCPLETAQIFLRLFLMQVILLSRTPVYKLHKIIKYKAEFHLYVSRLRN